MPKAARSDPQGKAAEIRCLKAELKRAILIKSASYFTKESR